MEIELRVFCRGRFDKVYWACPVGSANRMGGENCRIFSLLDLLNYLGSFSGVNGIVFLNEKVAGECYESKKGNKGKI
jgi:hypothetical protein